MEQTDKKALGQAKGLLTALQKKEYVEDFFGMSLTGSLADDGYQFKARLFGDDYLQYRAFLELFLQSPKTARLLTLALLRYEQLSDDFSFEDMMPPEEPSFDPSQFDMDEQAKGLQR